LTLQNLLKIFSFNIFRAGDETSFPALIFWGKLSLFITYSIFFVIQHTFLFTFKFRLCPIQTKQNVEKGSLEWKLTGLTDKRGNSFFEKMPQKWKYIFFWFDTGKNERIFPAFWIHSFWHFDCFTDATKGTQNLVCFLMHAQINKLWLYTREEGYQKIFQLIKKIFDRWID